VGWCLLVCAWLACVLPVLLRVCVSCDGCLAVCVCLACAGAMCFLSLVSWHFLSLGASAKNVCLFCAGALVADNTSFVCTHVCLCVCLCVCLFVCLALGFRV
jgi:hypothetical protein